MNNTSKLGALALLVVCAPFAAALTLSGDANFSAEVRTGGPRLLSGEVEQRFVNIQARENNDNTDLNNFRSFSVVDFNLGSFNGQAASINNFTFRIQRDNAGFSRPISYGIWLASDPTVAILPNSETVRYNDAVSPQGIDPTASGPFGQLFLIGSIQFDGFGTGEGNLVIDELSANSFESAANDLMVNLLNNGSNVRLVLAANDLKGSATYAGSEPRTSTLAAPFLEISADPIPEPATMIALGLGAGLLAARRRRNK